MTLDELRAQFQPIALFDPASLAHVEANAAAESGSSDINKAIRLATSADGFWPDDVSHPLAEYRPYNVRNGVLYVPVRGNLSNKFPFATARTTGYEYIQRAVARGVADPEVEGIGLIIDSPGGVAAGAFGLSDRIFSMRGGKPIHAYVNGMAASAAFAIASAADQIFVDRDSVVGSVGVVATHVNIGGALEREGVEVTFIYAGAHKVDGNPFETLSEDARERFQSQVDNTYSEFVSTVARNRSLGETAVRATEALTYGPVEALSVGFADAQVDIEEALAVFETESTQRRSTAMAAEDAALTAAKDEGFAAGKAEGQTEGALSERARIQAILSSEHCEGRTAAAHELAFGHDMTAEAAVSLLSKMPKAEVVAPKAESTFDKAMDATPNPEAGSDTGATADDFDSFAASLHNYLPGFRNVKGA